MNLYLLTNKIGKYYVAASDPSQAQNKLLELLNSGPGYGFKDDRKVTNIELLAEGIINDADPSPVNCDLTNRFLLC